MDFVRSPLNKEDCVSDEELKRENFSAALKFFKEDLARHKKGLYICLLIRLSQRKERKQGFSTGTTLAWMLLCRNVQPN